METVKRDPRRILEMPKHTVAYEKGFSVMIVEVVLIVSFGLESSPPGMWTDDVVLRLKLSLVTTLRACVSLSVVFFKAALLMPTLWALPKN